MRIAVLVTIAFVAGCQPIPAPLVRPFADGSNWVLEETLNYQLKETDLVISVPRGFVTDFASIPRIAWTVMAPTDRPGRAGIVHDFLYWDQGCTREQADKIMLLGMNETSVGRAQRAIIYRALRLAGQHAWDDNAGERTAGKPRVIPAGDLPIPPEVVWDDFREQLARHGVRPEEISQARPAPPYCAAVDALLNEP